MRLTPSAHLDPSCYDHLPGAELWPELEFTVPELDYPERVNCGVALLDDVVETFGGDRSCLLSESERWSYAELLHRVNQVAQVLTEDLGLFAGQRVLLRGPNNPWLVACWFGVLKAGGVLVTTMPLLRSDELRELIELTETGFALCDHRFADEFTDAAASGNRQLRTLCYGGGDTDDLIALAVAKSGDFSNVDTAAGDVAMLAPTSGTTGRPKATMQFHRDVLAVADTFSKYVLQPRPEDVFTGTPPLAFTFGLGGLVLFPLRVGAATVLLERATPAELADAVAEHGVHVVHVSTGQVVKPEYPAFGRSYQTPFADRIRNEIGEKHGITVIAVGAIPSHDDVNSVLLAGRADLVALGRPHLYDPHWTLHAAAEQDYGGVAWPNPFAAGSRKPPAGRTDGPRPRLELVRGGEQTTRHRRWTP